MPSRVRETPLDGELGTKKTVKGEGFRSDRTSFREVAAIWQVFPRGSCMSLSRQGGRREERGERLIERDQTEVPWE